MPSYCPRCGAPRLLQGQFCATCGFSFVAADTQFATEVPVALPSAEPPPTPSEREVSHLGGTASSAAFPNKAAIAPLDTLPDQRSVLVERSTTTPLMVRRHALAVPIGVGILAVALLASLIYGFTTTRTLDQLKADLTVANASLTGTQRQLDSTSAELTTEVGARTQAEAEGTRLRNQTAGLQDQLAAKDACVAALKADELQLQKIQREQIANFNRGTETSALAKAAAAYDKALKEQAQYYYNAFSNAWNGNYATANSWVDKGNSAVNRAATQLQFYDAEISTINAGTKKIEGELAALGESITTTVSLCGTVAAI